MRILIIDNNIMKDSHGAQNLVETTERALTTLDETESHQIIVRRAPDHDLPEDLSKFDAIVLSGSITAATDNHDWVRVFEKKLGHAISKNTPVLGVCYGHQLLARVLGGEDHVGRAREPEYGWSKIVQSAHTSGLLQGLSKTFYSFSFHQDEVTRLPKGCIKLAQSEICELQAFQLEGRPVFGIQFHPEKSLQEAEEQLLRKKKKGDVKKLLLIGQGNRYYDPKVGTTIFRNFLNAVKKRT